MIKVEVKNDILGDSVFWEGPEEDIDQIRNVVARNTAHRVKHDGATRKVGMWIISKIPEPPKE